MSIETMTTTNARQDENGDLRRRLLGIEMEPDPARDAHARDDRDRDDAEASANDPELTPNEQLRRQFLGLTH